jgi:hypothetical protein
MAIVDIELNSSKLNLRLDEMPGRVHDALLLETTLEAGELQGDARSNAESLLAQHSGKFVDHIKAGVRQTPHSVTGRVYSNDPTAALFEWGGHTSPHEIDPNTAHALRFLNRQGATAFAASVHHPGGRYDALQIIHSAFRETETEIKQRLVDAVLKALAET